METMTTTHSEVLGNLAKALASAQLEMKDAKKDSRNPHFKNTYASLSSVRETVTPVLAKHGLATLQTFEPHGDNGVCVVTWLLHESGQWINSRLYVPVQKKDAQGVGSAITYGRRYALAAICGIASDDDDDGEAAVGKREAANGNGTAPKADKGASDEAEKLLATLFDKADTLEALADVTKKTSDAVKAGALSDAARGRLRTKMAEANKRLGEAAA